MTSMLSIYDIVFSIFAHPLHSYNEIQIMNHPPFEYVMGEEKALNLEEANNIKCISESSKEMIGILGTEKLHVGFSSSEKFGYIYRFTGIQRDGSVAVARTRLVIWSLDGKSCLVMTSTDDQVGSHR